MRVNLKISLLYYTGEVNLVLGTHNIPMDISQRALADENMTLLHEEVEQNLSDNICVDEIEVI